MKTKNKTGPNTEPCGTPEVTDTWEDFSFSKRTVCELFDWNALTHGESATKTTVMKLNP